MKKPSRILWSIVAFVSVFSLGVPPLRASPASPPPQQRTPVEVRAIEPRLSKPAPPAAANVSAVAPAGRPAVRLEDYLRGQNEKWKQITARQIEKMRALIRITPNDDPQKADFLFRMGELYVENRRFYSHQARALDQRIFEAAAAHKAALQRDQQSLERQEQEWLLAAVKAFIDASRYPRYERMDEVLFRLAHLLTSAKKEDEARAFLLRLIKDHPASKYIPDSYLAFAELYFDNGDMDAAVRFYEKVEQFPASAVYPYAVYKKGWCEINRGDHKAALGIFVAVTRLAVEGKSKVAPEQLAILAKEARKDIVTAYAHVGGPAKAWEFFRRVGGESAGKMMEALAERYWEHGQAGDSSRVYRKIIAENPQSERLCEWQNKVLRNELSAGDRRGQLQELRRLAAVFQLGTARKKDRATECRNALHDASRELALVWHREGQRTRNPESYRAAEQAYRLFLAHFADDDDAYEMSYYAGETLWALDRWQDAAEQYARVVEMNPRGKYLQDAAYAAVLAWKNVLAIDEGGHVSGGEPVHSGARLAPQPIRDKDQKMIAAFQRYRKYVPDGPELPIIIYREAYIYYDHNQFDRSMPLFRELVEKHTSHELAPFAAELLLDALNAQGKTDEVVTWVRRFLETPALVRNLAFADRMVSLMSDAYDREARGHEKVGNAKECGRSFLAAAEARPDHAKHAERLWNAGQCFQNAHLIGKAVGTWEGLIKSHPGDVLAKRAIYRVAAGYHQLASYTAAATHYEDFARRFPGEPEAMRALGNATSFREGLGESAQALADMDTFVANYARTDAALAAAVFFQKADVYERQGRRNEQQTHLRDFLTRWGDRGGVNLQMQAHFRLGQLAWQGSCPRASENGACMQVERVTSTRSRQVLNDARRKFGKAKRVQCGPETKSRIVVLDRNRAQAAEAGEHLRAVLKLRKTGAADHVAAGAGFLLAEQAYEDLLRVSFPKHLDFSRPSPSDSPRRQAAVRKKFEDSNKRFTAYLTEKSTALEKARALYLEVFKLRQAQWTIAAAARIGQLHQDFAGQLYTAPIPEDLLEVDQWGNRPRDLYCDALEDKAGKVEEKAVEAFRSCLTAATSESWYNEWSRLCEAELNQMAPAQFPIASEIRPESNHTPTRILTTPVLARLSEDAAGGPR